MGFSDSFLVRPGSLFMFAVILVFGLMIFNWSAEFLQDSSKRSLDRGRTSVDCSTVAVDMIDHDYNGTHYVAYLQVNEDTGSMAVLFQGSGGNYSRVLEDPRAGEVLEVSGPVDTRPDVEVYLQGCGKVPVR